MSLEPSRLVRTLSTQHWLAAQQDLEEKGLDVCLAGEQSGYRFFVVKEGDTIRWETYFGQELVNVDEQPGYTRNADQTESPE